MKNRIKLLSENRRLEKQNTRLAVKNIILLAGLETIAENPDSDEAKKIIAKYKHRIEVRNEQEQAGQN